MGQYSVDLALYGWFPESLPSEDDAVESSDDENGEAASDT
jgi:methylated-DNA-protein-cysteine methyltransferase-like protein